VPWAKVLQLLDFGELSRAVINRLIDPGSELRIHRQWFLRSAMDELLEVDFAVAGKDRLYRCLDRILPHKDALCQHLASRWRTLFDSSFDVLLYDLTSTLRLRSGQAVLRGIVPGDSQGQTRLQPRWPARLPAGGDRERRQSLRSW